MLKAKVEELKRNKANDEMEKSVAAKKEERYQHTVAFLGQKLENTDVEKAELKE